MIITQNDINRIIELSLGRRPISADDRLIEQYGAESADIANIVVALEKKYNVHIPESKLATLQTPRDFYRIVTNAAESS